MCLAHLQNVCRTMQGLIEKYMNSSAQGPAQSSATDHAASEQRPPPPPVPTELTSLHSLWLVYLFIDYHLINLNAITEN